MAAGKISFVKTQGVWGFTALLVSAVCEWFLIILLLFDALLSYLLTKFASFCRLQAPCILCSRLDFALGGQKSELYQTLLCNNHISEITSLLPCHIHNKVADGVGMCDDCLLSFTAKTKANSKAHRLLVGKLGLSHGDCSFQCSLKDDLFSGSSDSRPCTCCGSITSHFVGKNSCDSLSYSGFVELKLHPESEFPFSADDNNVTTLIHENNEAGSDPKCQCTPIASSKFLPSDSSAAEPGKNKGSCCVSPNFLCAAQPEAIALGGTQSIVGVSPEESVDVSQASDNGLQSIRDHGGSFMKIATNAELFEKTDLVVSDSSHTSLRHKDREELKLLSQKSSQDSSTSLVIPLGDAYPPKKKADAASSHGTKVLQKSVSLDSGLGSMSGSIVSSIEEDSLVDQLKRQLTYDKQFINSLHKELEEERNASAIAANEAMAMITKLQEDKAALRMEALQYLRMMEEQAEHDAVALEKADDLLSEKEKMIQDLEAELDFYRLNLVEEPMDENMHEEGSHFNAANMTLQNVGLPHITNSINSSCNSIQTQNS